jgi:hypothetical protein
MEGAGLFCLPMSVPANLAVSDAARLAHHDP